MKHTRPVYLVVPRLLQLLAVVATAAAAGCAGSGSAPEPATAPESTALVAPSAPISREVALATFDEVWQTIDETHFDPAHLEAIGWAEGRDELRPVAADAETNDDLRLVLNALLERLGQSHFAIIREDSVTALEADDEDVPAPDDHDGHAADRDDGDRKETGHGAADEGAGHDADDPVGEHETTGDDGHDDDGGEAASDEPGTVGLDVRLIEGDILVTRVDPGSPAEAAGVRTGWIVKRVGSREMDVLLRRLPTEVDPRMRSLYAHRAVLARLDGPPGTTVDAVLLDQDYRPVEVSMRRRPQHGMTSTIGNLPAMVCQTDSRRMQTRGGASVGYIWFNIWLVPIMAPVAGAVDRFRDADGMVLDLRGNPGGIGGMSMGVAGHFLDEKIKFGTMTVRDTSPLNFVAIPQRVNASGVRVTPYAGPLAILVDSGTGSTSEIFAGGMQSVERARIFGSTTMGAALPARMPRLPNGDVLLHAFADFVDADGVRLEGRGVVPDEPVLVTRDDLLAGRDAVLEAALDWIERQPAEPENDSAE